MRIKKFEYKKSKEKFLHQKKRFIWLEKKQSKTLNAEDFTTFFILNVVKGYIKFIN